MSDIFFQMLDGLDTLVFIMCRVLWDFNVESLPQKTWIREVCSQIMNRSLEILSQVFMDPQRNNTAVGKLKAVMLKE